LDTCGYPILKVKGCLFTLFWLPFWTATSHGDDKMEEDSGSMGLIGEVVGLGDRIQEEQMHTGNKEHSLNSHDPVNHVCERRPNIGNVFNVHVLK